MHQVDVDVSSTKVGSTLWKLVKGYATGVSMDFSFLFEGKVRGCLLLSLCLLLTSLASRARADA